MVLITVGVVNIEIVSKPFYAKHSMMSKKFSVENNLIQKSWLYLSNGKIAFDLANYFVFECICIKM